MYFDILGLWKYVNNATVLHIAPEKNLAEKIYAHNPKEYVKGDLVPVQADVLKIDVTSIGFPDVYFDFIVCNHVLEHVADDGKALSELFRVLKPGGYAVLQTPYANLLTRTFEDESITSPQQKVFFYDKEDHMRVFGRDLFSKLEDTGFSVELKKHSHLLSHINAKYYGVNEREDLILVRKKTH